LLSATQLTKAGITDIRNVDLAGDFGGVWYWNRYPGARCDFESIYSNAFWPSSDSARGLR
ncbi:MAG: hypothetical protein ABWY20_09700, partial [Mycobacterium sp.]